MIMQRRKGEGEIKERGCEGRRRKTDSVYPD
jgi:hypothetical protein